MDSASATRPVFEPAAVGELSPFARRAMELRLEQARANWQMREALQEVTPREGEAPRRHSAEALGPGRDLAPDRPASGFAPPERATRDLALLRALRGQGGELPLARVTARPPAEDTPLPQAPARADQLPPRDGDRLREVAGELRALRAEVTQLSRMLGRPVQSALDFRGVRQPTGARDGDTQARLEAHEPDLRTVLQDAAEQAASDQAAQDRALVQMQVRRNELARVDQRQRDLVRALQRAERRLAEAPQRLPVGVRDEIIGEIYRARYSIALFGGAAGVAQLSGMIFDTAL